MRNIFKGTLLILAISVLAAGVLTAGGPECAKDKAAATAADKGCCTGHAVQASTDGKTGCAAHAAVADGKGCDPAKCPQAAAMKADGKSCGAKAATAAADGKAACPGKAMAAADGKACDPAACAAMVKEGKCDPATCAHMAAMKADGKACDPKNCDPKNCDPAKCPKHGSEKGAASPETKSGDKGTS